MTENTSSGLPRPGPLGRTVRLLAGVILLGFLAFGVHYDPSQPLATPRQSPLLYLLIGFVFLHLPSTLRYWGLKKGWIPQALWLLAVIIAALVDVTTRGTWWGPVLGVVLVGPGLLFLAYLGVSFLVAAIIAAPG